MSDETTPTPRPWGHDGWHVYSGAGMLKRDVAQLPGDDMNVRADAALIVAAVNDYDRLRAVETAAKGMSRPRQGDPEWMFDLWTAIGGSE